MQSRQKENLRPYRQFGLTLLQIMGGLAIAGFLVTAVLNYLF
jgi:hypothetical protein